MKGLLVIVLVIQAATSGCDKILRGEETHFANAYSETTFRRVRAGMSAPEVISALGPPLLQSTQEWSEVWSYCPADSTPLQTHSDRVMTYNLFGKITNLRFAPAGTVVSTTGDYLTGDLVGLSKEQLVAKCGEPTRRDLREYEIVYHYTRPGPSGTYKLREIHLGADNRVKSKTSSIYYD
jgi:outer membrane protein assembly factor BamE (lipoprotein component of BamABCDE complex)